MSFAGETEFTAIPRSPETSARISVGMMSPLWGLFAGAAVSGAAWWWMTRWARPANLEAFFQATESAPAEMQAETLALAAPAAEAIEEASAAAEPAIETIAETLEATVEAFAPVPVAEALTEAAPEPLVIEAAPIPLVTEALTPDLAAKPAPRARMAMPKVAPTTD